MRQIYKLLRLLGDAKAARRGPAALGKRQVRRQAHRRLARGMRRL